MVGRKKFAGSKETNISASEIGSARQPSELKAKLPTFLNHLRHDISGTFKCCINAM